MNKSEIVKQIQEELLVKNRKRILLQNCPSESDFIYALEDALQEFYRIVIVDCTDYFTLRQSMLVHFSCDTIITETAFEAGWRSHATEISIYSKSKGFEVVAGLHSIKSRVKKFLLSDNRIHLHSLDPSVIAKLYASYAWASPSLIVLTNYSDKMRTFLEDFFSLKHEHVPPILVCSKQKESFSWADVVLIFDFMPKESISKFLLMNNSGLPVEKVMKATAGETVLVKIFLQLYSQYGILEDSAFQSLDFFFRKIPEVATFLNCASVVGFEFVPEEILEISDVKSESILSLCTAMHLVNIKGRISEFTSTSVWKHILGKVTLEEKDKILRKQIAVIEKNRKLDHAAYITLAGIHIKLGNKHNAAEAFENAAILSTGSVAAAELFKKASLFDSVKRDKLLLDSAMNYYRAELYVETKNVVSQIKNSSFSSYLLNQLSSGLDIDEIIEPSFEKLEFPELLPEVLQSRVCHKRGDYTAAERLLLKCATKDELSSAVCLVELGQQLYSRGLIENSLNTMMAAGNIASKLGISWLERKALFTFIKAANTTGNIAMVDKHYGRLHRLTALSGNTLKLVAVNNLYANSQLRRQNYSEALELYSSSLKLLVSEDNSKDIELIVLNNMSVAQRKLCQSDRALRTLMRQVQTAVGLGNLSRACIAYGNMARQFLDLWKPDEASDCLETMVEFAQLGDLKDVTEIITGISALVAYVKGESQIALDLLEKAIAMARETGKRRRLSMNLVKKGSVLLRLKRYEEAVSTLKIALEESIAANSELNTFIAKAKLTAASCFLGTCHPSKLLSLKYAGNIDLNHKGEVMYYHWCLTGSRQSQLATAVLLSKGLSSGVSWHSYLFMLQEVACTLPVSLAETIPLLHNYPSQEQTKGQ